MEEIFLSSERGNHIQDQFWSAQAAFRLFNPFRIALLLREWLTRRSHNFTWISTNPAIACQCLGCERRLPERMKAAYGLDTLRAPAISRTFTALSRG